MKNLLMPFGVIILLLFSSCSYENTGELVKYRYAAENTSFQWTAFKYTEKAGVNGTFDKIDVFGGREAFHPMEVIDGVSFVVNTQSINTNSEFRDNNIMSYFFSQLIDWDQISGSVIGYEGNFRAGTLEIDIRLNNVSRPIDFTYTFNSEGLLEVKGSIDLGDFYSDTALDNMSNCCTAFHTGEDGVHKLWPDVALKIQTKLEPVL